MRRFFFVCVRAGRYVCVRERMRVCVRMRERAFRVLPVCLRRVRVFVPLACALKAGLKVPPKSAQAFISYCSSASPPH